MRSLILLSILLCSAAAHAQMVSAAPEPKKAVKPDTFQAAYMPHTVTASVSVGFIDAHRQDFSVPKGFEKSNTTGFAPIFGRVEYAATKHVSFGLLLGYDNYYANYYQLYTTASGNEYKRYKTDNVTIYSAGLSAYYHFGDIIPVKRLDVFVGVGFLLSNEHHSALPQGDSIVSNTERNASPALKVGARYYISNRSSFIADIGYDRQSLFSLGYSCRFMKRK